MPGPGSYRVPIRTPRSERPFRKAAAEARNRSTLTDALDLYDRLVLSQHRRGAQTRRALDGRSGLLTPLKSRKPASINRDEVSEQVRKRARVAPISANRQLAYASAFFNWCVEEGYIEIKSGKGDPQAGAGKRTGSVPFTW